MRVLFAMTDKKLVDFPNEAERVSSRTSEIYKSEKNSLMKIVTDFLKQIHIYFKVVLSIIQIIWQIQNLRNDIVPLKLWKIHHFRCPKNTSSLVLIPHIRTIKPLDWYLINEIKNTGGRDSCS